MARESGFPCCLFMLCILLSRALFQAQNSTTKGWPRTRDFPVGSGILRECESEVVEGLDSLIHVDQRSRCFCPICVHHVYPHPPDFTCRDFSVSASDEMRSDQRPGAIVILSNFTTCVSRLFLARLPAGCGRARHVALTSWQGPEPGTERSPRSYNAVSDCGIHSCRRSFR